MIDVAWSQILLLTILGLLLLGPKELPVVLKYLGRVVKKVRQLNLELEDKIKKLDE